MAFISGDNILVVTSIVFLLTWFGFWTDKSRLGKVTSGVVWIITVGILLSNFKITPFESPVYDIIDRYLVTTAIPLLLLKADLKKIFRDSGRVMIPLIIAGVGVISGVLMGYFLLNLGEIGPKVAGVYTAGYIGGAMNFFAVSKSVAMTPSEFSAAIGASSIVSVIGLIILVAIPSVKAIQRWIPSKIIDDVNAASEESLAKGQKTSDMNLAHLSGALALSFAICALSGYLSELAGLAQYNILFITLLAVAVANIFPKQLHKLKGEYELGMLFMYLFFTMVGLKTNMTTFFDHALVLLAYGMLIITVQFIVVLGMAKLLKIDLAEAITGSGAAIVGPAVTAAVVSSKGWSSMVTPAIMTGIFGYVVANFIGVALTAILS